MTTHTTRDHPDPDTLSEMETTALWAYVSAEVDYLSSPDQRRIPTALAAAIAEAQRRAIVDATSLRRMRKHL